MTGKADLAERLAGRFGSKAEAADAVDAVLEALTTALAAGERVTLPGFGTFDTHARPQRTARNPRTGQPVVVAATTVARFRPGTRLRAAVAPGSPTAQAPGSASGPDPAAAPSELVGTTDTQGRAVARKGKGKGKKSPVGDAAGSKKAKARQAEGTKAKPAKSKKAKTKGKKKSSRKG